ncbi:hypothetical protein FJZ36_18945, partial [Candidatus Poribacteria bacterium]|nr:hypothetical protein [Candidatus Poribacteria bacterium]
MSEIITLDEAIRNIRAACKRPRKRQPFFFMIGAGVSAPTIPLAPEIIRHCKRKAKLPRRSKPPEFADVLDEYSFWLNRAYGDATLRQEYFRGIIEGKSISDANLRLAHLLMKGNVAKLVVTTNFDDHLSRAVSLFGGRPIICDHPHTTARIDEASADLQIVHLHGSYWYYDLKNLKGEVEAASKLDPDSPMTMATVLNTALRHMGIIVVGYSGWERDVFMSALQRRLGVENPLSHGLYWFCYERKQVGELPEWLRDHGDVRIVAPEPRPIADVDDSGRTLRAAALDDEAGRLPARRVFEKLIAELKLDTPTLMKDPLGFFADQLEKSLSAPSAYDIHSVREVIDRVRTAKEAESLIATKLESVRDAIRRVQYVEAVDAVKHANPDEFTRLQRADLIRHLRQCVGGSSVSDHPDSVVAATDAMLALYDSLHAGGGGTDYPELDGPLAQALFNRGVALGLLGRSEEELASYEEVVRRFGDADEPELRECVARALVNRGVALRRLGRSEEELASYDEVVRRFGDAEEPELRVQVAKALFSRGVALGRLGRSEEELASYDEVVPRFGDAEEPELRVQVARALFNRGVALGLLGRSEEELASYEEVVRRFGDADEPEL